MSLLIALNSHDNKWKKPNGSKGKKKKQQQISFGEDGDVFNAANVMGME